MNETLERTGRGDEPRGVRPTDLDRGDRQQTAPAPAERSAEDTVDAPPVPPTDPGTDHGTGSFVGGGWARGAGGDTESVAASPSDQLTAALESGEATADATRSVGDRDATDDFALDPRFADPDTTLPPSPNERVMSGRPRIPGYEVLDVLGEGGMGIVYKARDVDLKRFVALKMIRAGARAGRVILERFEAEAKAVAGIDHPNIVKIFEFGEHDGQPYFSLEFLGGGNLAKKIGGKPQPAAEAAQIVEVLARAVGVAHEQKIIHRDLKPANVLIAADGTLKITDFGLVKQLEGDSGQTIDGAILGTPSYMAPEQARGKLREIKEAADQYALGGILYELLTGRPPFQGMSTMDTLDMVRGKDPVPPSQLQPKMHRDIETICLKCLHKEPGRRYADVLALAEDLRRFQANEPILARPVSGAERLWRWCLRNRKVAALYAATALLFATVLVVSAGGFVIVSGKNQQLETINGQLIATTNLADKRRGEAEAQTERAEAEQKRAETEREKAETEREKAETERQKADHQRDVAVRAGRAANERNQDAVDAHLELITLLEKELRDVPAIQKLRDQLLDKAARRLEAAAQAMKDLRKDIGWDSKDEFKNMRSLAAAHRGLAELGLSRNQFEDAMKHYRLMDEIIVALAPIAPPGLDAQFILIKSRRTLGFVALYKLGHNEEAQEYFRQAIAMSRAGLAKQPDSDPYKLELANSLGLLAVSERRLGHLEKARDLFREEIGVRKSFSPALANQREVRRELSGHYEELADLTLRMGDTDEGRRLYDECAAIRGQVAAEQPESWPIANDLARSYNNEGMVRFPYGRDPAAARGFHHKAVEVYEKRVRTDPAEFDAKTRLAETLYYEATCALHAGDADAAADGYRRCRDLYKLLATEPKAKVARSGLMLALARCGEHAEAAKIADSLMATPPQDENHYFLTACGYALAAGAARGDDALVRQYTKAAIASLRKGKERGWAEVVALEIDPDLEPIRKDPALQSLISEFRQPNAK
jgi:eukaryotic-like serine/threonine-protein kinase